MIFLLDGDLDKLKSELALNDPDYKPDCSDTNTDTDSEETFVCPNPKCDHNKSTSKRKVRKYFPKIEKLQDLIDLAETYHCYNNETLNGIDLYDLCKKLQYLYELNDLIGLEDAKTQIAKNMVMTMYNDSQGIIKNNHYISTGPPGVGKSQLAEILSKLLGYKKYRFVKASDLIEEHVGGTAKRTQECIDSCIGGILIIDEVYSLADPDKPTSFSRECIDTINRNMTELEEKGKRFSVYVIGYKEDIKDRFLKLNSGLESRFNNRIDIKGYSSRELADIFLLKMSKENWKFSNLEDKDKLYQFIDDNYKYFSYFGRDMKTLLNETIKVKILQVCSRKFIRNELSIKDVYRGFEMFKDNQKREIEEGELDPSIAHIYV